MLAALSLSPDTSPSIGRLTAAKPKTRPDPSAMVRHRFTEAEFQLPPRIVVEAPIAAHRPFQVSLPRLVEGLDKVHLPVLGLSCLDHAGQEAGLVGGGGKGAFPHPPCTRPTHLADPDLLAGESSLEPLPDLPHMGDGFVLSHRIVLPIREDVDGDEVGGRCQLGGLQPELPDVGIGDGKA
jgi:hypothetical protein